jgi:hypothetical protein
VRAHSRARMPHLRAGSCVHKNVCANASIAALPNATRPSGLRAAMRPVELCIFRGDTIAAGAEVQDSPGWFGILCPAATHPYYFLPLPLSPPSPRSHTRTHRCLPRPSTPSPSPSGCHLSRSPLAACTRAGQEKQDGAVAVDARRCRRIFLAPLYFSVSRTERAPRVGETGICIAMTGEIGPLELLERKTGLDEQSSSRVGEAVHSRTTQTCHT